MPQMNNTVSLFVRLRIPGIHSSPESLTIYERHPHRHIFYIEVSLDAYSNSEKSSAITLRELYKTSELAFRSVSPTPRGIGETLVLNELSCAEIADSMSRKMSKKYDRTVCVSVSEDDERGAIVTYDPEWD